MGGHCSAPYCTVLPGKQGCWPALSPANANLQDSWDKPNCTGLNCTAPYCQLTGPTLPYGQIPQDAWDKPILDTLKIEPGLGATVVPME